MREEIHLLIQSILGRANGAPSFTFSCPQGLTTTSRSSLDTSPIIAMTTSAAKYVTISKRFNPMSYENQCLRCGNTVYPVDKVGPLKDFTFFHKGCLKCHVCGSKLTLKTYFNNQQDQEDREVRMRVIRPDVKKSIPLFLHPPLSFLLRSSVPHFAFQSIVRVGSYAKFCCIQ